MVQGNLRIARARAQCPHHDRRPAALTADQLGNAVNLISGKGDNRRTPRHPRQLARTGVAETGETRAGNKMCFRQQTLDHRPHRLGPQKHRFITTTRMQQAVRENMTAIGIGAKLDFIDREKFNLNAKRHRFHRANIIARIGGQDFLFPRDQRHCARAPLRNHPVVNFARQQPQRQSDDAACIAKHPLNGQMRFAGICGPQHGGDVFRRSLFNMLRHFASRSRQCCAVRWRMHQSTTMALYGLSWSEQKAQIALDRGCREQMIIAADAINQSTSQNL